MYSIPNNKLIQYLVFGGPHTDGAHTRSAAPVRDAKRFVQVQVAYVSTDEAGGGQGHLRIHVRTIHVHLLAFIIQYILHYHLNQEKRIDGIHVISVYICTLILINILHVYIIERVEYSCYRLIYSCFMLLNFFMRFTVSSSILGSTCSLICSRFLKRIIGLLRLHYRTAIFVHYFMHCNHLS